MKSASLVDGFEIAYCDIKDMRHSRHAAGGLSRLLFNLAEEFGGVIDADKAWGWIEDGSHTPKFAVAQWRFSTEMDSAASAASPSSSRQVRAGTSTDIAPTPLGTS